MSSEIKEHATITIPLLEYGKLNRELTTLRTRLAEVEAQLQESEWLLSSLEYSPSDGRFKYSGQCDSEWLKRRDTFLNPTNKDVK